MRGEKGGCTMKQGKLIRRAVSAALAGCMMFTFSAPALAESTDALMQLSTAAKSAVSVLDAENGDTANYGFTIDLNGTTKTVNESNCKDIFEDKKLSYDPITNKLTNNGTIGGKLTIDAPNVDVELTGNSSVIDGYSTNLNIKNARNVTLSTNSFSVVGGLYSGNVEINCSGKLTIKNSDFTWPAIKGDLTVHNALEILVEGRFSTVVGGDVKIECACPATFKNNQNGGIAKSITYAGDYVYYTSDATDAEAVDPNVTSIPAETAKYVSIAPKMRYNIYTAEDATIKLQGQSTELKTAFAGEKVTVTAAGKENAEFTGWTAEGITLTDEQKANPTVTFTMPGNNVTLTPNYNVVQDFGIEVSEQPVTSENYKNLWKGYIVYDPKYKTLTAKDRIPQGVVKIRAPETDVFLNGGMQRGTLTIGQVEKKTVVGAHDVTVKHDQYAAVYGDVNINCTGKVDIRSDENMAVNGSLNIYNSSEVTLSAGNSVVTGSANITSDGDVTIESTDGRAAQKLTINKAEDVTISISDDERAVSEETKITASGTVTLKNNAPGGHVGTVDFTQADGKKYVYYTSEAEDAKLIDPRIHPLAKAEGSSYLRIEPRETYYSITVANGTAQVGDDTTGQITTAFEGETVTVKANAPTDEDAAKGVKFHHWKVEEESANIAPTAGSLGSATEAGTAEISFDMPNGNVKLTAVYSIPASVLRSTVTVEGGTAKSTLGEGSDIPAEIGTEVEITATPYDAEKYPGMEFVEWEIVYPENFPENVPENLQLKLDNAKSATTTFKMPVYPVKLIAHWSASPVAKPDPDEPIDEDFGVEPAPMDTTGGTIAAVAVGGAAIWGGYEIATRVILHSLLPEGAAIPANRGELAMLLWQTAGKPEPAAQPAFADVADPDMAKAAQWCTEQGTMDAKGDCFEPEGWTPKFKVIEVWNKAFPKQ